jgi:hypothetical protein
MNEDMPTPLSQWVVRGDLATIRAYLKNWLADLPITITMDQEKDKKASGKVVDFCLTSEDWGNLGRLHLVTLDSTQTLLAIYLPPYPSDVEVQTYEPQIREAIPPPAAALRMFDLFGPLKVNEFLRNRLHELRLHSFEQIRQTLAQASGGVAVEMINKNEERIKTLRELSLPSIINSQEEYPENIPAEKGYSDGDIPATSSDDQRVLQLWRDGQPAKRIAHLTGKTEKTILNRLSLMRKTYGEQAVPRRR